MFMYGIYYPDDVWGIIKSFMIEDDPTIFKIAKLLAQRNYQKYTIKDLLFICNVMMIGPFKRSIKKGAIIHEILDKRDDVRIGLKLKLITTDIYETPLSKIEETREKLNKTIIPGKYWGYKKEKLHCYEVLTVSRKYITFRRSIVEGGSIQWNNIMTFYKIPFHFFY